MKKRTVLILALALAVIVAAVLPVAVRLKILMPSCTSCPKRAGISHSNPSRFAVFPNAIPRPPAKKSTVQYPTERLVVRFVSDKVSDTVTSTAQVSSFGTAIAAVESVSETVADEDTRDTVVHEPALCFLCFTVMVRLLSSVPPDWMLVTALWTDTTI